jgi:outer membrane protein assembly factor BamB
MTKRVLLLLLVEMALAARAFAQAAPLVWKFVTGDVIVSSPGVGADGTIFIGSYDRNIYALTPNGSNRWSYGLPPPTNIYGNVFTGIYGTPALGLDGTLYVPSENGRLIALNPTNGAEKWIYLPGRPNGLEDGLYSSPAVGPDGSIYFGSYDRYLYAVHPNGTTKWSSRLGDTIFASPAVGPDGTVYCGCDDGQLYALDPANGATKWTFDTGNYAITAAPAIAANGDIYLGVGSVNNPRFYSISTNGMTNWIFTTGSRVRSSAAIGRDGTIYFGCDDGKLYAVHPDGAKKWDFPAGGAVGSSPAVAADGTIYFGCDDGKLYAVDPNGNFLWSFPTGSEIFSSPALGPDGAVYIASGDYTLYVLRRCSPPANSSWPMFRNDLGRTGRRALHLTNQAPVLAPIADWTVVAGTPLVITNSASDADTPPSQLQFNLGPGAPAGASIGAANGLLTWTPTDAQGPGTNIISVAVSDTGWPARSDAQCFTVTVLGRPVIETIRWSDGSVTITWRAQPGSKYRVQTKPSLTGEAWSNLPGDVTATGETATKDDSPGNGVPQNFYRVMLLP